MTPRTSSIGRVLVTLATLAALSGAASAETLIFKPLVLINGWTSYPNSRVPAVAIDSNDIVRLRGAIHDGTQGAAFVLPQFYRPSGTVYVPVTLLNGAPGRVNIAADGTVSVQSPDGLAVASGYTSLEGVKFPKN